MVIPPQGTIDARLMTRSALADASRALESMDFAAARAYLSEAGLLGGELSLPELFGPIAKQVHDAGAPTPEYEVLLGKAMDLALQGKVSATFEYTRRIEKEYGTPPTEFDHIHRMAYLVGIDKELELLERGTPPIPESALLSDPVPSLAIYVRGCLQENHPIPAALEQRIRVVQPELLPNITPSGVFSDTD